MENQKKYILYSLLIVLVVGFFIIGVNLSNAIFQQSIVRSGTITLGRANVMFSTGSILFDNVTVSLGDTITRPVKVINALNESGTNTEGLIDCYLRVKTSFLSNGVQSNVATANLTNPNNWVEGEDGFLYYKSVFGVGQEVPIYDSFSFSHNITMNEVENGLNISILAQTVQADGASYKVVWDTAPNIW